MGNIVTIICSWFNGKIYNMQPSYKICDSPIKTLRPLCEKSSEINSDEENINEIAADFKNSVSIFNINDLGLDVNDTSLQDKLQSDNLRSKKYKQPKVFKWCTCHRYTSSTGKYPGKCFKDCELRTPHDDPRDYRSTTLAGYVYKTTLRENYQNYQNYRYNNKRKNSYTF